MAKKKYRATQLRPVHIPFNHSLDFYVLNLCDGLEESSEMIVGGFGIGRAPKHWQCLFKPDFLVRDNAGVVRSIQVDPERLRQWVLTQCLELQDVEDDG